MHMKQYGQHILEGEERLFSNFPIKIKRMKRKKYDYMTTSL